MVLKAAHKAPYNSTRVSAKAPLSDEALLQSKITCPPNSQTKISYVPLFLAPIDDPRLPDQNPKIANV